MKFWPWSKKSIKPSGFELNKELQQVEFQSKAIRLKSLPTILNLPIADKCNLKCIMCSISVNPNAYSIHMDDKAYGKCFELFPYIETLTLEGAEVFTLPHGDGDLIDKIAKMSNEYNNLKLSALTNAQLINDKRVEYILDKFSNINISIDTPNPDVYSSIRVGGKLETLINNVNKINAAKAQAGRGRHDFPKLLFSAVVMERTFRDLPQLLRLVHELGGAYFSFQPLRKATDDVTWDNIKQEDIFSNKNLTHEYLEVLNELERVSKELGINFGDRTKGYMAQIYPELSSKTPSSSSENKTTKHELCRFAWSSLIIEPRGSVKFACCSNVILGNINTNSIEEIWNGEPAARERLNFIQGNFENCGTNCQCYFPYAGSSIGSFRPETAFSRTS